MPRFKTQAIIINARDFSESDRIITMLSNGHGLITAIAKGAKNSMKRFPGTLEPFNEIEAELYIKQGADILRLEEAKLINANLSIREDLAIFAHASVLLELVYLNLAPMDPHPLTYSVLKKSLSMLSSDKKWFCFWATSLAGILKSLGYEIDIKDAIERGDILGVEKISGEASMFLERAVRLDSELLSRLHISQRAINEITFYMTSLCEKISGRSLRTVEFLKSLN